MTATPNHALQRTAPRVTVAANSSSNPFRPCAAFSYARSLSPRSTTQLPRHAPPSLSLGSLDQMIPRLFLAACLLSALSCAAPPQRGSAPLSDDDQLVGVFLSNDFDFSQSLKVRRADHTFTEYRFQVPDYAKPPAIALTLQGTWALKAKQYCETVTQSSYAPWDTLVGKTQCYDIVTLTPDLLQYFSRDSAPIRERKLNEAESTSLLRDPFSFVSDAVRQKYGFERH